MSPAPADTLTFSAHLVVSIAAKIILSKVIVVSKKKLELQQVQQQQWLYLLLVFGKNCRQH